MRQWIVFAMLLLGAQAASAQRVARPHWFLTIDGSGIKFTGAAIDSSLQGASVRPSQRLGLALELGRASGPWEVAIVAGVARGHVEIESSSAAVEDKTFASHRYRVGLIVGRHVVSLGSAEVIAAVGPALDRWTLEGADPRIRVGGEGRLKVRMPLGERIALENGLIVGLSASPWEAGDLTPSEFRQTLRTLAVSAGIRVRL